jgi:hypothetical protein
MSKQYKQSQRKIDGVRIRIILLCNSFWKTEKGRRPSRRLSGKLAENSAGNPSIRTGLHCERKIRAIFGFCGWFPPSPFGLMNEESRHMTQPIRPAGPGALFIGRPVPLPRPQHPIKKIAETGGDFTS